MAIMCCNVVIRGSSSLASSCASGIGPDASSRSEETFVCVGEMLGSISSNRRGIESFMMDGSGVVSTKACVIGIGKSDIVHEYIDDDVLDDNVSTGSMQVLDNTIPSATCRHIEIEPEHCIHIDKQPNSIEEDSNLKLPTQQHLNIDLGESNAIFDFDKLDEQERSHGDACMRLHTCFPHGSGAVGGDEHVEPDTERDTSELEQQYVSIFDRVFEAQSEQAAQAIAPTHRRWRRHRDAHN